MKRVFTEELKSGTIIGKDIYSDAGQLIIPANTIVNRNVIDKLNTFRVDDVFIKTAPKRQPFSVQETKEFKNFKTSYLQAHDKLNNSFNRLVTENEQQKDIDDIIKTGIQIFEDNKDKTCLVYMLHCMNDYSDVTFMHSVNVGLIASLLGKWLGWSDDDQHTLMLCGLFHDIGKLKIPTQIIDKPGKLDDEEYDIMKSHTMQGYSLIRKFNLNEHVKKSALMHHERVDGTGYPLHIKGDEIDRFAQIISIADVYDAMTADRSYRKGICPFDVIDIFESEYLSKFNTGYLLTFLSHITNTYMNTAVQLSNGDKAEIIMINKNRSARPVVVTANGRSIDLSKNDIKIQNLVM